MMVKNPYLPLKNQDSFLLAHESRIQTESSLNSEYQALVSIQSHGGCSSERGNFRGYCVGRNGPNRGNYSIQNISGYSYRGTTSSL